MKIKYTHHTVSIWKDRSKPNNEYEEIQVLASV